MKRLSIALLAAVLVAAPAVHAGGHPKPQRTPALTGVAARPFQLKQVYTRKISAEVSQSLYKGETVLTFTPGDAAVAPYTLAVKVDLMTTTTLNANGAGFTDGVLALTDPLSRQTISGPLVAVNQNFGELTGLLEGRMYGKGNPARLRAAFNGVFVPDASGAYTLVNVTSHGVLIGAPRPTK